MERQPRMAHKTEQAGKEPASIGEPEKEEELTRSEKYLLAAALVMGALLILYNALSGVPLASPQVVQAGGVRSALAAAQTDAPVSAAADGTSAGQSGETASHGAGASSAGSAASGKLREGETIDLNAATVEELMRLPGVGEKTADAIYRLRQEIGGFRSVGDLIYVDGIGQKTVDKLAPYLRVEE